MGYIYFLGFITAMILVAKSIVFLMSTLFGLWGRHLGFGARFRCDQGEHAVIVGATGTIGREYVQEFALMGYNLVLISRKSDKLQKMKRHINARYNNVKEIVLIKADFTKMDCYKEIESKLSSIRLITVLVNCTTMDLAPGFFWKHPPGLNRNMVLVNVMAPLLMMEMLMPRFMNQGHGIVINIGSHAGDFRFPAKSFIHTLSETVSTEARASGVYVQTVKPCFVESTRARHHRYQRFTLFMIEANSLVYSSLVAVGIEASSYGHLKHKITALVFNTLIFLIGHRMVTALCSYLNFLYVTKPPTGPAVLRSLSSDSDISMTSISTMFNDPPLVSWPAVDQGAAANTTRESLSNKSKSESKIQSIINQ